MHIDRSWMSRLARAAALLLLLALSRASRQQRAVRACDGGGAARAAVGDLASAASRDEGGAPVIAHCRAAPLDCRSIPGAAVHRHRRSRRGLQRYCPHRPYQPRGEFRDPRRRRQRARHARRLDVAFRRAGGRRRRLQAIRGVEIRRAAGGGHRAHDLRIVIVAQRARPGNHAVVAVRNAGRG